MTTIFHIAVCRKPISEDTVAANVVKHGVGGLNIDGCRIFTTEVGERNHHGAVYDGVADGYKRPNKSSYTHKTDWKMPIQGRWPANLIHDGSDEVMREFPFSISGGGEKHPKVKSTFMVSIDRESYKGTSSGGDSGSAARFFKRIIT